MRRLMVVAMLLILVLASLSCTPSAPPTAETPTPPAERTPIKVIEFDGLKVSLTSYRWEGNKLVTEFSFLNDRPRKNESMMIYAYDQHGNRVSAEWPIMSAPVLWPGETKDKTITWQCGPQSTVITIHLDDHFQDTWTKKSLTISR